MEKAMSTHATGNFEVKGWDEKTWDGKLYSEVPGPKLTHAVVTQTFHGDLEGEAAVQYLMTYSDIRANFVGLQQVVGRIGKRSGSFVLEVSGTFENGKISGTWSVVPGSGTDELSGLRGTLTALDSPEGAMTIPYALDYEFE